MYVQKWSEMCVQNENLVKMYVQNCLKWLKFVRTNLKILPKQDLIFGYSAHFFWSCKFSMVRNRLFLYTQNRFVRTNSAHLSTFCPNIKVSLGRKNHVFMRVCPNTQILNYILYDRKFNNIYRLRKIFGHLGKKGATGIFQGKGGDFVRALTWQGIYRKFRKVYPRLSRSAIGFHPAGDKKIYVELKDGTKMLYDDGAKRARVVW